ncbi:hypothetical protein FPQ18DRAFT_348073 [Pyronema domesticum]|nr:hypothetical protein FPQ18DRAFT_348073 [Pyronema domesticum]
MFPHHHLSERFKEDNQPQRDQLLPDYTSYTVLEIVLLLICTYLRNTELAMLAFLLLADTILTINAMLECYLLAWFGMDDLVVMFGGQRFYLLWLNPFSSTPRRDRERRGNKTRQRLKDGQCLRHQRLNH